MFGLMPTSVVRTDAEPVFRQPALGGQLNAGWLGLLPLTGWRPALPGELLPHPECQRAFTLDGGLLRGLPRIRSRFS